MKQEYISTSKAAVLADVTTQTIRNLCKDGVLSYRMQNTMYYPLKADVIKYKDDVQKIHQATINIDTYKEQLNEEEQKLCDALEEQRQKLIDIQMYPARMQSMRDALYAVLKMVENEYDNNISKDELNIMWSVLQGNSFTEAGWHEMCATRQTAHNKWKQCLHKISTLTVEHDKLVSKVKSMEQDIEVYRQVINNSHTDEKRPEDMRITNALNRNISEFELSARAYYAIKANEVYTIRDLIKCGKKNLLKMRNFGKKSIMEIEELIDNLGLSWYTDTNL